MALEANEHRLNIDRAAELRHTVLPALRKVQAKLVSELEKEKKHFPLFAESVGPEQIAQVASTDGLLPTDSCQQLNTGAREA